MVLNFSGSHDSLNGKSWVRFINVRSEGIPLSLFTPVMRLDGKTEDADDICEAVADVFSNLRKLGSRQRHILLNACEHAVENCENFDDDMECLYTCLMENRENAGQIIIDTFRSLLKKVKFIKNGTLWEEGKVTVLYLSEFTAHTQLLIAELVMNILWRYNRINGQMAAEPVWIVCDEFQSLNLKNDSILTQILREGRKFKLSLLLATQTLSTFDTESRAILQQAGTKLYFRPSESDIQKISKDLPGIKQEIASHMFKGLAVGECLATGEFQIREKLK